MSSSTVLTLRLASQDRTGVTAALVLSIIGATRSEILRDYIRSEAYGLSDKGRAVFAHVPEMDARYWGSAQPEEMDETLNFLDREYGSVNRYLTTIGFDRTWQHRLMESLVL